MAVPFIQELQPLIEAIGKEVGDVERTTAAAEAAAEAKLAATIAENEALQALAGEESEAITALRNMIAACQSKIEALEV